mmetsp:Transcript_35674/g.68867  ORF Transcript_35674/g.68867 Transcript_35674/m.68867 type:complete len:82 (+) Transcript_35674:249-494(+)
MLWMNKQMGIGTAGGQQKKNNTMPMGSQLFVHASPSFQHPNCVSLYAPSAMKKAMPRPLHRRKAMKKRQFLSPMHVPINPQ